MKKIIFGFNVILIFFLGLNLNLLWKNLTHNRKHSIFLEDFRFSTPPTYRTELLDVYGNIFDVRPPTPVKGKAGKKEVLKRGQTEQSEGVNELLTKDGLLIRVRAIFTTGATRLALVETLAGKKQEFSEVREDDVIAGARVMEVAPGHVSLLPEQNGEEVKLAIFDRSRERTSPRQPPR